MMPENNEVENSGNIEGGESPTQSSDDGKFTLKLGGKEVSLGEDQIPLVGNTIAAIVLLIAMIDAPFGPKNKGYGIAVAIISLLVSLGSLVLMSMKEKGSPTWDLYGNKILYFLLIWNSIGASILTFNGPYLATSNGYFACWALVFAAVMAIGVSFDSMKSRAINSSHIMGLQVSSIILFIALIVEGLQGKHWGAVYSLIISIFTATICTIFIYADQKAGMEKVLSFRVPIFSLFATLWIVLVFAVTFSVFAFTGNGYFAAWAGCLFCIKAASSTTSTAN